MIDKIYNIGHKTQNGDKKCEKHNAESLGKYFNSIFLSTVMTLLKHFEIDPLLKKPQDKMALPP
jgi:hypothetical protein